MPNKLNLSKLSTINNVATSLRILTVRNRIKYFIIILFTATTGLLDLVGIFLFGMIALSLSAPESNTKPSIITEISSRFISEPNFLKISESIQRIAHKYVVQVFERALNAPQGNAKLNELDAISL